jgi:hypothetical protein
MVSLLAVMLAAQAAPPVEVTRLNCRALAANGATIDFPFELRGEGAAQQGRVAIRNIDFTAQNERRFPIGGLPNTLVFDLSALTPDAGSFHVRVSIDQQGRSGLQVAHGYCQARPIAPSRGARISFAELTDAHVVAAAAARGPCYMLTLTGEVSRFRTRIEGTNRIFEPLDALVWSGQRSVYTMGAPASPPRWPGDPQTYSEIFGDQDNSNANPVGYAAHQVDQSRALAVTTIIFTGLGPDPAPERQNAMSICAFGLQRRPA